MLENLDKITHLHFSFDACPMHSPFGFVHMTHQNLSARALFCLNSLAKVNTQLLIYKCYFEEVAEGLRFDENHKIDSSCNDSHNIQRWESISLIGSTCKSSNFSKFDSRKIRGPGFILRVSTEKKVEHGLSFPEFKNRVALNPIRFHRAQKSD